MLRWIIGLPLAALITALLFLVMARLIAPADVDSDAPADRAPIVITFDPPPPGRAPPPDRPVPPEAPEPPGIDLPDPSGAPGAGAQQGRPDPIDPDISIGGGPFVPPGPNISTPPPYPQNCIARGAAGVVIVEFDVDPRGNVINPRIVSSPDRCFDRPILKAIQTWKYSPNFENDTPVVRRNVRETLRFELEDS